MNIQKIYIPPLPFGFIPTYFDNRKFSLTGLGRGFHFTPRLAKPYQTYYIDRGCTTVNINAGYSSGPSTHPGEYTALNRANRSVFLGPEYIQDSREGKPFKNFTLDDCRTAVAYAWGRANGYGCIVSGAQEGRYDNDQFAQLSYGSNGSASAYKNMAIAWGEIMTANPATLVFDCYDGMLYFNPFESAATHRTALASNANALAFMKAHVYEPNPYFRDDQELWRYRPPLINLYFRAFTNLNAKLHEILMAITLVRMALTAVGKDWPIMVFVFPGRTEFVSYPGQGYSELYVRDVNGGGTYQNYDFPDYSHAIQWYQTFYALALAGHYYGWQDTQLGGTDPTVVPVDNLREGDNFPLRKLYGGTGITQVAMGPTPYNPASTYPYPASYEGATDIAPCAAEMYEYVARFGGQNAQLARHKKAGTSTWCSLDSSYLVDRFVNNEPVVHVARAGNLGWVCIGDFVSPCTGPYDLDIDVGSGQTITVPVEPHGVNLFTFSL